MKNILPVLALTLLAVLFVLPQESHAKKVKKIVHVLAPFTPILEERRPESPIIVQAKKGDRFPLVQEGEYWAQVYIPEKDEVGWIEIGLETKKIEVLDSDSRLPFLRDILIFAIILGAIGIVVLIMRNYHEAKRKKALESVGGAGEGR
ncbi:MAG: hypothetical protein A2268_05075 [Candidatus Raymondbacteria bacterium RifOxyA12_full_50_37]|uniref:SH3b domain-containing protein n=1 Tax=Candidatus Raymondbacteria bacterium RIFOXYD12_FULL_49_13 TaxID=1817890 RepID=A0A1F7FDV2_UNCRA|nr:MAG: hypothetical protein A2248_10185 [Candidatus Raymondbacteria bacterium RIFOXYA2_FULL_49_16]OGJ88139.1 MAG: hypothetical protein A2268_05075 [Candidatus Raymondbacteria bacterium RifOxyA12_full_50_37]OGJ96243.1 MAG: hypothetical protein A2350_14670 [Candidatus Raymondbacteria bacterium RifOxyB12_full_50_8]OGJ96941.1 MAG: hypothetical protein A2453_04880 [Candidatus Raymondbacteria bacterium RIFOXYC2_FULL_50_21]OGK04667.1 MAG: hypothetical protein A2519_21045 [Candidatus Raymondbacteria b